MSRPKPTEPGGRVSISMPQPILDTARGVARGQNLSLSAWIAELIREYLRAVERRLR